MVLTPSDWWKRKSVGGFSAVKRQMGRSREMASSRVKYENMKFYITWGGDWPFLEAVIIEIVKKKENGVMEPEFYMMWRCNRPFLLCMNFEFPHFKNFINFVNFRSSVRRGSREWVVLFMNRINDFPCAPTCLKLSFWEAKIISSCSNIVTEASCY